jgi:hypothetical protein
MSCNELAPQYDHFTIELDGRLDTLDNYYILPLNPTSTQTIHRITGRILKNGEEPYPPEKIRWESSHYWVLTDTLGYIVRRVIQTNGSWANVDTIYIRGFQNSIVPTVNSASYSGTHGEINTVIAPIYQMRGDTMTIKAIHHYIETSIRIILN